MEETAVSEWGTETISVEKPYVLVRHCHGQGFGFPLH